MIDKIKLMNDNFNPDFILKSMRWKEVEIEKAPFKKGSQSMLYNDFKDGKRIMGLGILLTYNMKTETYSISIQGSIRKWYYKNNSRKDLNYNEFINCIELIGEKLGLKRNEIWGIFKITILEVGVTLLLKSYFHNIMNCFLKYRNSVRNDEYETTIYFDFKNYTIILYDKFIEMNKGQIWSKKEENIFSKFHYFRFEISVNKLSGSPFKKDFNNLEQLKNNWYILPKILESYLKKIEFVDLLSKEKEVELKSNSDFIKNMAFLGMKSIGLDKAIKKFNNIEMPNNKSKYFSNFINIYVSNISSDRDYRSELMYEFKKKTDRLV